MAEIDYSKCSNGCSAHAKLENMLKEGVGYFEIQSEILKLIESCPVYKDLLQKGINDKFSVLRWHKHESEVRCHFYGFSESNLLDLSQNPQKYEKQGLRNA